MRLQRSIDDLNTGYKTLTERWKQPSERWRQSNESWKQSTESCKSLTSNWKQSTPSMKILHCENRAFPSKRNLYYNDFNNNNTRVPISKWSGKGWKRKLQKHLSSKELKRVARMCWMCGRPSLSNLNDENELPPELRRSIAALCDQSTLKIIHDEVGVC